MIALLLSGCIQEMSDQPRYDPLEANAAYSEKLLSRVPVAGTIARGELQLDIAFATGKENGQLVLELPEAALAGRSMNELLAREGALHGFLRTAMDKSVGASAAARNTRDSSAWWFNAAFRHRRPTIKTACAKRRLDISLT